MIAQELFFQPGNSASDPRVLVSLSQGVPNTDGSYRAPYPKVAGGLDDTASISDGFLSVSPSQSRRLIIGSNSVTIGGGNFNSNLYACDQGGTTWTTYAQAVATGSSPGADAYVTWTFCQYGDQIIAANRAFPLKTATTGAFSTVSNAPHARCVESFNDALWAWNVYSGGTNYYDWLWISDIGDETTWTPASSNEAFQIQLTECPGPGTAMIRYRDFVVIFKARGMWIATYTGDIDNPYEVPLFSANVGCLGPNACIVAEDRLYFADDQNVYEFDGATIRSIADPHFITKELTQSVLDVGSGAVGRTQLHYDDINKVLSVYGPDGDGYERNLAYTYNIVGDKWGKIDAGSQLEGRVAFMLNAPVDDLIAFENLGVTATSNENRVHMAHTAATAVTQAIQNGHDSDTAGAAVTAYFGSPFQAQTLTRVFMNADSNTGVTVSDATKRAPRSGATTQSSTSAASVSADMVADLTCDGNFHKLTWAWNAQTNASPADFRSWRGFETEGVRSGKR